jgi:hypothetical protein
MSVREDTLISELLKDPTPENLEVVRRLRVKPVVRVFFAPEGGEKVWEDK